MLVRRGALHQSETVSKVSENIEGSAANYLTSAVVHADQSFQDGLRSRRRLDHKGIRTLEEPRTEYRRSR